MIEKIEKIEQERKVVEIDKKYHIRKWKAKEKKAFLNTIKHGESIDTIQDILVYNCIDEQTAFSPDEFKYIMSQIRQYSLGSELELEFYCKHCKNKFISKLNIDNLIRPIKSNIKDIKTKNYNIKVGSIKNSDFYRETINSLEYKDYVKEVDFYLRIDSINDNDCMSLDDIIDLFDNMDIDEFDNIFNQWEEIRFKVDDVADIECPSCKNSSRYKFDEIPGFFPPSWFN